MVIRCTAARGSMVPMKGRAHGVRVGVTSCACHNQTAGHESTLVLTENELLETLAEGEMLVRRRRPDEYLVVQVIDQRLRISRFECRGTECISTGGSLTLGEFRRCRGRVILCRGDANGLPLAGLEHDIVASSPPSPPMQVEVHSCRCLPIEGSDVVMVMTPTPEGLVHALTEELRGVKRDKWTFLLVREGEELMAARMMEGGRLTILGLTINERGYVDIVSSSTSSARVDSFLRSEGRMVMCTCLEEVPRLDLAGPRPGTRHSHARTPSRQPPPPPPPPKAMEVGEDDEEDDLAVGGQGVPSDAEEPDYETSSGSDESDSSEDDRGVHQPRKRGASRAKKTSTKKSRTSSSVPTDVYRAVVGEDNPMVDEIVAFLTTLEGSRLLQASTNI